MHSAAKISVLDGTCSSCEKIATFIFATTNHKNPRLRRAFWKANEFFFLKINFRHLNFPIERIFQGFRSGKIFGLRFFKFLENSFATSFSIRKQIAATCIFLAPLTPCTDSKISMETKLPTDLRFSDFCFGWLVFISSATL